MNRRLKKKIKSSFIGRLLISEFHCIESWIMPKIIDDETAIKRFYKKKSGKELNLENPVLFSEKINWYKLNGRKPLMQQCADKYAVREYVEKCGFKDSLNELYGVYYRVSDIKLSDLPKRFVLKPTHGSQMIIIWPNTNYKWWQVKLLLRSWLHQNIYWVSREWVYKDMPRRIIAEKYLEDEDGDLKDYKFYCFNGKPKILQFDAERFKGKHFRNFYDMNLTLLDLTDYQTEVNPKLFPPLSTETFQKMREMAEVLAKPFQHVRVDFYYVQGKIYFGELTFFHGGGEPIFPKEKYERMLGDPWILERD